MQPASWIKDAVIYQIYPQSFQDSNGDGIGDFPGLISRLDYIKSIGVDTIWLNPCFDSPFGDAGYDVRDFYKIAPRYGSEEDFDKLVAEAHARGIKVVLDLVAGHTSMDNAWFQEEAANPKSPDSNRYIWKNRDFDPAKGPAREDFYANFFWHQPGLNYGYANPEEPWQDPVDAPGPRKNREELCKIMGYWFERGCDGFRVDMAFSLIKPHENPKAKEDLCKLWQEVRAWIDANYPEHILIAEWSDPTSSVEAGFDLDFMLHFNATGYPSLFFNGNGVLPTEQGPCFFSRDGKGSLKIFREEYTKHLKNIKGKGYMALPVANHDFQRLRCAPRGWDELRAAWVFFVTQAGPPTLYYGEEIGMRYVEGTPGTEGSTFEDLTAVNAGTGGLGERAGTRTPMQWDDSDNAGFSTASAEDVYLPLDPDPKRPTVAAQEVYPNSLLNFVRKLLKIRKAHPALWTESSFTFLNPEDEHYPMVYLREGGGETIVVAINPSETEQSVKVTLPGAPDEALVDAGCSFSGEDSETTVTVAPFAYGIFLLK